MPRFSAPRWCDKFIGGARYRIFPTPPPSCFAALISLHGRQPQTYRQRLVARAPHHVPLKTNLRWLAAIAQSRSQGARGEYTFNSNVKPARPQRTLIKQITIEVVMYIL